MTAGRPQKKLSQEQMDKIAEMAFNQCHLRTIAGALGLNEAYLRHNKNIYAFIQKKRCDGRVALHSYQVEQAKKTPVMGIWLGKQYLEQSDKQDLNVKGKMDVRHYSLGQLKGLLEEPQGKDAIAK